MVADRRRDTHHEACTGNSGLRMLLDCRLPSASRLPAAPARLGPRLSTRVRLYSIASSKREVASPTKSKG